MAVYTETNLKAVIDSIIASNGNGAITGPVLNQILTHFIDSCVFKLNNTGGGSGDTLYTNILTLADLDVDSAVEIIHNLNTLVPIVIVWDNNGEILTGINFSAKVIDANTVELTFEDPPAGEESYKYMVIKKTDNITVGLDYIETLYIDFYTAVYEGTGYYRKPVGWNSFTTLYDGTVEDHLSADTHHNDDFIEPGIEVLNRTTATRYWLVLQSATRYVEAGETYSIVINWLPNVGSTLFNAIICGNTCQFSSEGLFISFQITAGNTELFYIKTDSNDDLDFFIQNLTITKQ
jgi:hypothetical protein